MAKQKTVQDLRARRKQLEAQHARNRTVAQKLSALVEAIARLKR